MNKRIISAFIVLLSSTLVHAHPSDMLERLALIDTGYDACVQAGGQSCSANKNLLFRGDQPLPDDPPFDFEFDYFHETALQYLEKAKSLYQIDAPLPTSVAELNNYRIVIINLLYDFKADGGRDELNNLENEFKNSGAVTSLQIPEQHHMYGLDSAFRPDHYAFEWWPVQLSSIDEKDPEFLPLSLNWPSKQGTPVHAFKPDIYKPLNFPALITGKNVFETQTSDAKGLHDLLMTIPADGHPLLIYYHCVAGKDRTGAVSASYFMTYGGYPFIAHDSPARLRQQRSQPLRFKQAIAVTTIPDHPANQYSVRLSSAYCLFLGKEGDDCNAVS